MKLVEKDTEIAATVPASFATTEDTVMADVSEEPVPAEVEHRYRKTSNINWRMTLGYSTPEVVSKTLNSTHYFATTIEPETRAYPRHHRQKRLLSLHVRRIPGRSCGDSFFSSTRSVRGCTYVQLFAALFTDFLWMKSLRREPQVPGVYRHFISELLVVSVQIIQRYSLERNLRTSITKNSQSIPILPLTIRIKTFSRLKTPKCLSVACVESPPCVLVLYR